MTQRGTGQPVQILLVEDNPGDVGLTRQALAEARVNNDLHVVDDGVKAVQYLRREGEYASSVRPDIILLDLSLPRMGGREVLEVIKADPDFLRIPVVVLTSSGAEQDVIDSYALHANCFITKPVDFDDFISVIKSLEEFWMNVARLPVEE